MTLQDLENKTIVFDWGKGGKQTFRLTNVNFTKPYRNYKWLLHCEETQTGVCFQTDDELKIYLASNIIADKTIVTIS